jgi:hypothetical protein
MAKSKLLLLVDNPFLKEENCTHRFGEFDNQSVPIARATERAAPRIKRRAIEEKNVERAFHSHGGGSAHRSSDRQNMPKNFVLAST